MKIFSPIEYKYKPTDASATKEEIEALLDGYSQNYKPDRAELLKKVKEAFPIITSNKDKVRILGSANALKIMNQIVNPKIDRQLAPNDLTDISFKRMSSTNRYEMLFKTNDGNTVSTIYNAKNTFLNHYSLAKHAHYLLKHDKESNLLDDLNDLQSTKSLSDKKEIYRFIEDGKNQYLRAIVSDKRYKFYDNPIALYIALAVIDNYARKQNEDFIFQQLIVTDSRMLAIFLEKEPVKIDKNVTIRVGLSLSNSELGDGSASFNMIYTIQDNDGNQVVAINDEIANINHGNNPESIQRKFEALNQFENERKDIIAAVKKIEWSRKLSRDDLDAIAGMISHIHSSLPENLKKEMAKCTNADDVLKKSYTLMKLFGKFNSFIKKEDPNIQLIMETRISRWLAKFENKK